MNESEVSDPKMHNEAVMKRCKLLFVRKLLGEDAISYNRKAKVAQYSPVSSCGLCHQRFETVFIGLCARNNGLPCSGSEALFVVPSFPTCQT
jgi:hypothetical protein